MVWYQDLSTHHCSGHTSETVKGKLGGCVDAKIRLLLKRDSRHNVDDVAFFALAHLLNGLAAQNEGRPHLHIKCPLYVEIVSSYATPAGDGKTRVIVVRQRSPSEEHVTHVDGHLLVKVLHRLILDLDLLVGI